MSDEHESPIRTPKQLIWVVALAFIVPILLILLLVSFVGAGKRIGAGSDALTPESIEARIKPVAGFELRDANAPRVLKTGEQVFKAQCTTCHTAGVAGAPKFGDAAAWGPRIATGFAALWNSALKGKGNMPPQAGGDFDDQEIGGAVAYMANAGGAKFEAPKAAPAPAAQAATAPAAAPAAPAPAPVAAAPVPAAAAPAPAAPAPVASAAPAGGAGDPVAGKALYDTTCFVCHGAGVAGAPKFGDKAAWAPRIATGMDELLKVALAGKGAMPPKGGKADASEQDIKNAIAYMVAAAK